MKNQTMALMMIATAMAATAQAEVTRGIVNVRADLDVKATVEQLNKAVADFKAEHTKQLEELKKGHADSLQALKVDTINAHISDLQAAVDAANTKMAAMEMGVAGVRPVQDKEYSDSFLAHMRRGEVSASLNKGTAAEGGFTVPIEWDRTVTDKLVLISPMRELCSVQSVSGAGYKKLINLRGTGSGWVGETAARPETNTPQFAEQAYGWGEIYANPSATQQMLDDSELNLEQWLAGEVQTEFSFQENKAFVSGDGTNKPRGLLTYAAGGSNLHPLGGIAITASGAVGAVTSDAVLNLIYSLPSSFTGGARFAMNRNTQLAVRKLKDGQNNYLWQPSMVAGQPATLAGYAITEVPDLPDIAANALSIAFGDFKRAYKILDRIGVRVLRDPFTNKPYVSFYTTKRVGGGLENPECMKFMRIAAS
jgi:HK97 family phage major capsid protein